MALDAWLEVHGLADIKPQLAEWGVETTDELEFIEDFDIEDCGARQGER